MSYICFCYCTCAGESVCDFFVLIIASSALLVTPNIIFLVCFLTSDVTSMYLRFFGLRYAKARSDGKITFGKTPVLADSR